MHRHGLNTAGEETITLDDGRTLWLRPIHPADAEPLRATFALLSPTEIRMRFLHPLTELTPAMAERLTNPDPQREIALVLAEPEPPGNALVGAVARAIIDPNTQCAEFAIIVAQVLTGQGLGRLLVGRLIEWARDRGLRQLHGDVLLDNTRMLRLCDALGFRRESTAEHGVLRVVHDLGNAA